MSCSSPAARTPGVTNRLGQRLRPPAPHDVDRRSSAQIPEGMIVMVNLGTRSRKPPKDEATRRLVLAVALASAVTVVGVIIIAALPPPSASKTTLDGR